MEFTKFDTTVEVFEDGKTWFAKSFAAPFVPAVGQFYIVLTNDASRKVMVETTNVYYSEEHNAYLVQARFIQNK